MSTDPDQIRAQIAALLAEMPDVEAADADIDTVAARLEEAHELLVQSLESVEKGPAGWGHLPLAGESVATPGDRKVTARDAARSC